MHGGESAPRGNRRSGTCYTRSSVRSLPSDRLNKVHYLKIARRTKRRTRTLVGSRRVFARIFFFVPYERNVTPYVFTKQSSRLGRSRRWGIKSRFKQNVVNNRAVKTCFILDSKIYNFVRSDEKIINFILKIYINVHMYVTRTRQFSDSRSEFFFFLLRIWLLFRPALFDIYSLHSHYVINALISNHGNSRRRRAENQKLRWFLMEEGHEKGGTTRACVSPLVFIQIYIRILLFPLAFRYSSSNWELFWRQMIPRFSILRFLRVGNFCHSRGSMCACVCVCVSRNLFI